MIAVRIALATSLMMPRADDDGGWPGLPSSDADEDGDDDEEGPVPSPPPPPPPPSLSVTSSSSSRSIPSMSYCLRSLGSSRTFWARFRRRNVAASPPGRSGWCLSDSFLYCFLTRSESIGGRLGWISGFASPGPSGGGLASWRPAR
jgi:hypothetical protein